VVCDTHQCRSAAWFAVEQNLELARPADVVGDDGLAVAL
jgi:hypothetical protein